MQPKSSIQVIVSSSSERSVIDAMVEQLRARYPEVSVEFKNGDSSDGQPMQAAIQNWVTVIYRQGSLN